VVRSWNTAAGTPGAFGAGLICDGQAVPPGFEGLHVFDVSHPRNPELVAAVRLPLLVYNNSSAGGACAGIDIVQLPLDDPGNASYLRFEPAGRSCHDTGVILGDAMMAACAGGDGFTLWRLAGSLEDPAFGARRRCRRSRASTDDRMWARRR
jgi:hypothetical protein